MIGKREVLSGWGERCANWRVVRKLESEARAEDQCANLRVMLELESGYRIREQCWNREVV